MWTNARYQMQVVSIIAKTKMVAKFENVTTDFSWMAMVKRAQVNYTFVAVWSYPQKNSSK